MTRSSVAQFVVRSQRVGLHVCAALLLGIAAHGLAAAQAPGDVLRAVVRMLDEEQNLASEVRRHKEGLRRYYGAPEAALLWADSGRLAAFARRVSQANADGLKASDYPVPAYDGAGAEVLPRARIEIVASAVLLDYASDLKVGRLTPRKVGPGLFAQSKTIDPVEVLSQVRDVDSLDDFFWQWAPHNPEYRALRGLLTVHREIAAAGGWGSVPEGGTIKPGMRGARVAAIRARLKTSGDITIDGKDAAVYDPALVLAVKGFQRRHGLEPDGVVGKATLAAMNVPVTARIEQIVLNMDRWRWLPEDLGDHYILVNIAGFELTRVEAGAVKERMRIVVGKPFHRTPVFSDRIRYLEFNPYWNVPFSIAVRAELPQFRKDPGFIARMGFEVFRDGKRVDPATVDWSSLSKGDFPYTLRQKPGPKNALGRVKFMFPNEFSVYLHDTPAHGLFRRASRAFSSGCIRLERPIDLAEQLLRDVPGWDRKRIDAVLETTENIRVELKEPLPVHLTYSTAWTGAGGRIHFRPDVYRRDERLRQALFGK